MKTRLLALQGVGLTIALVFVTFSSRATPVAFYIDSSASSLTLSGEAFGLAVTEQSVGSLADYWGGILAVDLTGGVLTFAGGSTITAALNPSNPFSTFPNPGTGGVDNYGVFASGLVSGIGLVTQLNGAYRSLVFDITSGTAENGQAPSGMNFEFTGGHLDWGAIVSPSTPYGGTSSMVGVAALDTAVGLATFDGFTLTLPVQLHTLGSNRYEDWAGTIVAVIPEPSSVALSLVGLGLLAARARARARR
jgi:hypothetical protein